MSNNSLSERGFTDSARHIIEQIVDRASDRGLFCLDHTTVPTLALWTLIRWERKVGLVALETMGIDLGSLAHRLDEVLRRKADENRPVFSADKKRIVWDPSSALEPLLNQAESEARALQHDYVGSEHLLLATITEADPQLRSVLDDQVVSYEVAKETILELLGP